jgi:hypothetical protein
VWTPWEAQTSRREQRVFFAVADAILALVAPLEAAVAGLREERDDSWSRVEELEHDLHVAHEGGKVANDEIAALATAQEQNERYVAEIAEARAAWADVSALFAEGVLIRDTSKDADFPAFTSQSTRIVNALTRIGDALPAPVKETRDG